MCDIRPPNDGGCDRRVIEVLDSARDRHLFFFSVHHHRESAHVEDAIARSYPPVARSECGEVRGSGHRVP